MRQFRGFDASRTNRLDSGEQKERNRQQTINTTMHSSESPYPGAVKGQLCDQTTERIELCGGFSSQQDLSRAMSRFCHKHRGDAAWQPSESHPHRLRPADSDGEVT